MIAMYLVLFLGTVKQHLTLATKESIISTLQYVNSLLQSHNNGYN